MVYLSILFSAFVSATLLPASSELLLSGMVAKQMGSVLMLWGCATLGNVLGSCVNYYLGTRVEVLSHYRWFPVSESSLSKARKHYQKFGPLSLLFAWLPIIGDPLTLVAGVFKVRLRVFLLLVTLGKGLRYALVIALAMKMF
ncbi:YqaA family protein [Pseudoalteromonas luteoviolacea]|uniref:VTT domain-containing protein n=1 Tax=Pseudoalteromonas luteoviolacea NCIMB 1942 TaxID=1365253 RepID=A0A161YCN4_9GAMM|nr:YqaA family protein [Pseudoalteromonas luteoviolacea]KZN57687.1 hypothetical protein N482_23480 [Pseudoalteromonas luteoviolacea NCIMB 1942]KZW98966.1 membrane protein [Pseudoalteromonas luteoviolacea]